MIERVVVMGRAFCDSENLIRGEFVGEAFLELGEFRRDDGVAVGLS